MERGQTLAQKGQHGPEPVLDVKAVQDSWP